MGTFTIPIEIGDLEGNRFVGAEAMVDTGAVYTMVPEDKVAGLTLLSPEIREFQLADESLVEYQVGYLRIRFQGKEVFGLTIIAPEGTTPLLGATALENALLAVDPYHERLVPIAGSLRAATGQGPLPSDP